MLLLAWRAASFESSASAYSLPAFPMDRIYVYDTYIYTCICDMTYAYTYIYIYIYTYHKCIYAFMVYMNMHLERGTTHPCAPN